MQSMAVLRKMQNDVARLIRIRLFAEQQTFTQFADIAAVEITQSMCELPTEREYEVQKK